MAGCTGSGGQKDATVPSHDADFAKTMNEADSLYNCMQFRDAYKLYLKLLDSKEAEADSEKRLSVLNALSNTSELSGHKVEQNKWLQQLLDLAEQTGNDYYHSLAHVTMGQNLYYEGDREKGIHSVTEAIDLMAKTDRENTDHLIHGYLNMLASMYGAMNDYDHALKTCERNLQLTMEGTRWGTAPNQQLIDRRMALAKKASTLAQMGRSASGRLQSQYYQQADSAYDAWKAVEYEGNHTRDYFIVDYMKKRGRYQEAATIYNDLIERVRQQGDTLGEMMNTAKWGLAEVYRKMGYCNQAANLYEQVLEIQDTLKSRKAKHTAQELAAVYHDKEQDQMIMQQQTENTRQRYLLFIVLAVLVGVVALAVVIIRKNRIISRKNQSLAAQIAEAINYKQMYWNQKLAQKQEQTPKPAAVSDDDPKELTDEQLFLHINEVVMQEHLFLDPNFDRQAIMDRFQLSKERVGAVFSKGSEHVRLNKYILQLRLEYAAHLLINDPGRTIVQVAADCGFSSNTYFSDRFRQHYGMSPTDFRTEAANGMNDTLIDEEVTEGWAPTLDEIGL
jgi:AraC-like DNA-binding protein